MKRIEDRRSYKDSLKATSLFGGVQVYNILISIIRSKIIAILLGPAGMGISGLFTSTTGLITSFTNLGIASSSVRDIAMAHANEDERKVIFVVSVFRKLVWVTGLMGLVVCLFFSPVWSKITFGNYDYIISFAFLSFTLLLTQLSLGQITVLQGIGQYRYMAKATLVGNTVSLLLMIPLYYIWKIEAIVPTFIVISLVNLIFSWYYSRKVKIKTITLNLSQVFSEGKSIVKMGIFLSLNGFLAMLSTYIVRVFVNYQGGIEEVGLYSAGFTLLNTYTGLVFNAMGTEYYPRLSTYSKDKEKFSLAINQQMEIGMLLVSPLIITFIVFADVVLNVLYSNNFLAITEMLYIASFGFFFRMMSWSIAYSFAAKGDGKTLFVNELVAACYMIISNIIFYKYWGLTGLGFSFVFIYFLYLFQVSLVCKKKYNYKIDWKIFSIFFPYFLIAIICALLVHFTSVFIRFSFGVLLIIFSLYLAFKILDEKINVKEMIRNKFRKS